MLVLTDKDVSKIIGEDVEKISHKYLVDKKVSTDNVSRLIFKECSQTMRKQLGDPSKKGLRYSPLLFCRVAVLRNKLKDGKFTSLAQNVFYPSTTKLNSYSNSRWKDTDTLCHETLEKKKV